MSNHPLAPVSMDGVSKETAASFTVLTIESLAAAAQQRDAARRHLDEASAHLYDEIRAAVKAGIPISQVAKFAGMARQNVYVVLRSDVDLKPQPNYPFPFV